jgi:hypothetical protein
MPVNAHKIFHQGFIGRYDGVGSGFVGIGHATANSEQ